MCGITTKLEDGHGFKTHIDSRQLVWNSSWFWLQGQGPGGYNNTTVREAGEPSPPTAVATFSLRRDSILEWDGYPVQLRELV